MVTLQDVLKQAQALAGGPKPTSVELALWAGALSCQQELEPNGRALDAIRFAVESYLPDRDTLASLLRQARCFFTGRTLDTLYYVEMLSHAGKLRGFEHIGNGYAEHLEWRDDLLALVQGHGLSFKTVSFAALLIDPLHCELVPVDRHVMAMRNVSDKVKNQISRNLMYYAEIELEVMDDRDREYPGLPTGLYHWLRWEQYRQSLGISSSSDCQPMRLNPREY